VTQAITVSLDDKFDVHNDHFYLNGSQALVRLMLLQRAADLRDGLNTAGFVSGYRGSPLGAVDQNMMAARKQLEAAHVRFQAGLNEEIAGTSIWGTQQTTLFHGATVDGVFSLWYGKGPGVDRAGDVFKHANFAGTSRHGGVLLVAGDDHGCKSSTVPHQSEPAFAAASIPVLVPADVGDVLRLGLHGYAMSRWSGRYIGFKTVADVVDSSASVLFDLDGFRPVWPGEIWPDLHIRLHDLPLEQEVRLFRHALPAAQDYARANGLDRLELAGHGARLGIVTAGKSLHDTRAALALLGLDEARLRLLRLALVWPADPATLRDFAAGLDEIVVVEEKSPLIEGQLRDVLFHQANRPRVVGKRDERGAMLLKPDGEFAPIDIAIALGTRLAALEGDGMLAERVQALRARREAAAAIVPAAIRTPYFCPGCPHNTSTKVIDGSRAMAGIGCHYMALWMNRSTETYCQMGGEGAAWIGQAPFTEEEHVFANIGDGTYFHSGILAIRAAVSAGVNITYKVLFNDAVAMTGGQHIDGTLTVPQLTRQLAAEGVVAIAVVAEDPEHYGADAGFAPGVEVFARAELASVEKRFRATKGCTAIVYDQVCASEKRRRRKRGKMAEATTRAYINPAVCEGCGDCSRASNCVAVTPLPTEFGTKRQIDQSACNKDLSCVQGFCPSFVTIEGVTLRKGASLPPPADEMPEPALPALDRPFGVMVAGIGGTGVVTLGALLGMAAHQDGVAVSVLDQMGLAQKGGAVFSHIRLARRQEDLQGLRVHEADLLLGCDLVVAGSRDGLAALRQATQEGMGGQLVLNSHASATADFVLDPSHELPAGQVRQSIAASVAPGHLHALDASALAVALLGDALATNPLLLGYAWQQGLIPLTRQSLETAIRLNGTAVAFNLAAFAWGRLAALDLDRVAAMAGIDLQPAPAPSLDEIIATRAAHLRAYQGAALARRYLKLVERVRAAEAPVASGGTALTEAVARGYHRVLAIKDEYEVARLYADPAFRRGLAAQFEGTPKLTFHLAPPLLARRDKSTGQLQKRAYGGAWMERSFAVLARLRWLRGTVFDPFGYTEERREERALIGEYQALIEEILNNMSNATMSVSVKLAAIPESIVGYGHVKRKNLEIARKHWWDGAEKLRIFNAGRD
jgi:indolepyruvate ferredoxin oxidoreductase